jgi:hypothetical protein
MYWKLQDIKKYNKIVEEDFNSKQKDVKGEEETLKFVPSELLVEPVYDLPYNADGNCPETIEALAEMVIYAEQHHRNVTDNSDAYDRSRINYRNEENRRNIADHRFAHDNYRELIKNPQDSMKGRIPPPLEKEIVEEHPFYTNNSNNNNTRDRDQLEIDRSYNPYFRNKSSNRSFTAVRQTVDNEKSMYSTLTDNSRNMHNGASSNFPSVHSADSVDLINVGIFNKVRADGLIPIVYDLLPEFLRNVIAATKAEVMLFRLDKISAAAEDIVKKLKKFAGEDLEAADYFLDYCQSVCMVDLPGSTCINIMVQTTHLSAKEWVVNEINEIQKNRNVVSSSTTSYNVLAELIKRFRLHFLGVTQKLKYKNQMKELKLVPSGSRTSMKDLQAHYGLFNKYKRQLMICDLSENEDSMKEMWVKSLPYQLQLMISNEVKGAKNVDELYKKLESITYINDQHSNSLSTTSKQHILVNTYSNYNNKSNQSPDLRYNKHRNYDRSAAAYDQGIVYEDYGYSSDEELRYNDENNNYYKDYQYKKVPEKNASNNPYVHYFNSIQDDLELLECYATGLPRRTSDMGQVICFYCGERGHFAGDCKLNDGTEARRTNAGRAAYIAFKRTTNTLKEFDAALCKKRAEERRARIAKSTTNSNKSSAPTPNKSNKPIKPIRTKNFGNKNKSNSMSSNRIRENEDEDEEDVTAASYKKKQPKPAIQVDSTNVDEEEQGSNTEIKTNSHSSTGLFDTDDEDQTNEFNGVVVTVYAVESNDDMLPNDKIALYEKIAAGSLCLPIEMNGVNMQYALVDQGANRGIIRRSAINSLGLAGAIAETAVKGHYVKSSSGAIIPISGRFNAKITTDGHEFGVGCFYIVEDDEHRDIICDVILGRTSIAASNYPIVDTRDGRLINIDTTQYVQCLEGKSIVGPNGKPILQPKLMGSGGRRPPWSY